MGLSEDTQPRETWGAKAEFLLSCIGYCVGLGNVWRFPYLCYRNGGGAFLIPYAIMLFFTGLPYVLLEGGLGQFASLSPIKIWNVSPMFRGLGWSMVIITAMAAVYYNVIIAWILYYLFASLTSKLPWTDCNNSWNTNNCVDASNREKILSLKPCNVTSGFVANCRNATASPAQEFFDREVLKITSGLEEPGPVNWQLAVCLLLSWLIVLICLIKGIKSSGKVVYFTAIFPYVVLVILLIRNTTLEGAGEGIRFYIIPDFNKLSTAMVWKDAATQIFYSLGISFGGVQLFSSYNPFHNNLHRDAIIIAFLNCGTSFFAGFVIFSVLGHMAHELDVPVGTVARDGPGLAFVAYPYGITTMPIAPLWAVLFFLMIFFVGLDTQFGMVETIIASLVDRYDLLKRYRTATTVLICLGLYLLGIPIVTNGGMYLFNLVDWYCASFSLLILAFLESIAITWVYGFDRFSHDMKMMFGHTLNIYWRACLMIIAPTLILFVLLYSAFTYTPAYYGDYQYPWWGILLGWGMVVFPLLVIIGNAFYSIWKYGLNQSYKPNHMWGPALKENRIGTRYERPGDRPHINHKALNGKHPLPKPLDEKPHIYHEMEEKPHIYENKAMDAKSDIYENNEIETKPDFYDNNEIETKPDFYDNNEKEENPNIFDHNEIVENPGNFEEEEEQEKKLDIYDDNEMEETPQVCENNGMEDQGFGTKDEGDFPDHFPDPLFEDTNL